MIADDLSSRPVSIQLEILLVVSLNVIDSSVPQQLRDAIERQLADGEIIIRLEQPAPDRFRWLAGRIAAAMGALFAVGIVFLVVEVFRGNGPRGWNASPWATLAWSLPLLGGTATMMAMPLYLRWTARNLAYAITNRRVLTVERGLFGNIEFMSFGADKLEPRSRRYADGVSGDIELIANRVYADETSEELVRLFALRDLSATEAELRNLIQSSSNSSL